MNSSCVVFPKYVTTFTVFVFALALNFEPASAGTAEDIWHYNPSNVSGTFPKYPQAEEEMRNAGGDAEFLVVLARCFQDLRKAGFVGLLVLCKPVQRIPKERPILLAQNTEAAQPAGLVRR